MLRAKRRVIWIVVATLFAIAVIATGGFVARQRARADADLAPGQIVTVSIGSLSAEASASGRLLPDREASFSFAAPGKVKTVLVQVGDGVKAGDVLIQLETEALERALRTAQQTLAIQEANLAQLREAASEADVLAARAAVESAQLQLDDILAGPSDEEMAAAEASVVSAEAQLDDLLAGPDEVEVAQAKAALASAQAMVNLESERYAAQDARLKVTRQELDIAAVALENAQYFYNALANDWQHKDYADFSPEVETLKDAQTAYDVALARYELNAANINDSALRSAQAQEAQARANLNALTEVRTVEIAGAREQLAQARAALADLTGDRNVQIASARSQLAQAQANLASLLEGASQEKLAIAEAQVAQAHIAVANAQSRLQDATLFAPFDGAVTAVNVTVGERATGPVVDLVDTSSLEVVLDVDEVDIGQIAVGMQTVVTLDVWPDEELRGEVVAIAPSGSNQTDIVTYQVHISLQSGDLPVRTGMTANARLVTAAREDVLLVANRAITADRSASKYYVHRVEGDEVVKVEVTIGLRDSGYTEITSGLEPGDQVIVDYEEEAFPFGPDGPHSMGS